MQTFLPLPDYLQSMRCLDKSRLGNQVWREGMTLVRGGWKNHPASKMWKKHEYHLCLYLLAGIEVLKERGKDYPHIRENILIEMAKHTDTGAPPWVGNEEFHASHRRALLYKNPEWYSQFGWNEEPDIPNEQGKLNYIWPVN
jgi:hypothetical protein